MDEAALKYIEEALINEIRYYFSGYYRKSSNLAENGKTYEKLIKSHKTLIKQALIALVLKLRCKHLNTKPKDKRGKIHRSN